VTRRSTLGRSALGGPTLPHGVWVGLLVLAAPAGAQTTRGEIVARIDSIATARIASGDVAGMAVGVVRGGELLLAQGYGYADREHRVPTHPETVFRLGSLTKQFTALAVLQLVEQGKLSLDDDVTRFFPGYPTHGRRIPVARLLDHTSGIANYTALGESYHRDTFRLTLSPDRMVGLFRDRPPDFLSGDDWSYTNSGYFLAGLIVEKASGMPYAEYLRTRIFEPLGLGRLSYCDDRTVVPHRAKGYSASPDGLVNAMPIDLSVPYAAGALCGTVLDLLAYQRALDGLRIVARGSYDRMRSPARLHDGWETTYGLGLVIDVWDGHRMVGHGGQIQGAQSMLFRYPDDDLTVVVLENTFPALGEGIQNVTHAIARAAMGLPAREAIVEVPISASDLQALTGSYGAALLGGGARIRLRADGGTLLLEGLAPQPLRLVHVGGRAFRMREDASFRLEPGSPNAGRLESLRLRVFGLTVRAKRVS
jgi:CubicO group peptidase (beta-lactamase class C family)